MIALALVLILLTPSVSPAQQPGTLRITVRDLTGVIPGASVSVVRPGTPATPVAQSVTDADGVAVVQPLAAGTYDVRVTFTGFADASRTAVVVAAGASVPLEVTMTLPQYSAEVTVTTANRREQLLLEVADPTVLIDRAQIADTGARTAKDLLIDQTGAGIQVQAGGGQGHLSLNGIPNSGVLVLIDGRRYLGKDANGSLNLEDLPLTGVERVEVVKGAGSALYGSDAIGGVVNFVTRQSKTAGVTNLLEMSGGSYGDWRVNETLGYRRGRGGISGSGGYRRYDGFDLSESNPQTIGQPESTWWSATLNADYRLGDKVFARLAGDYSKREIDNYFFSGATQLPASVYNSQRALTRYSVSPTIDIAASPSTMVTVAYTGGWYLRDETRIFRIGGRVLPQAPWREWNTEFKATATQTWRAFDRDHALQGGIERREETLERGTLTVSNPSRDITTFWLQQEFRAGSRLTLTAGVRHDDFSDFGAEWSPKASVSFRLSDRHRLRASAGHGYRPPYFGELYLNTPPSFVGNPNLKPETANTYNAGYSWAAPNAHVSVDAFLADVTNGITFDLRRLPFTYANLREFTSRGVNVAASVTVRGGFTPSAAYTFTDHKDSAGTIIGGIARHAGMVKLLWSNEPLGLRANIRGELMGALPPNVDGSYQPSYQVWNTQVNKRLVRRGLNAVNVYVQASNIFNTNDVYLRNAQGDPIVGNFQAWLAPRTFMAGVTLDLGGLR